MGSESNAKLLRKQLRNVVQELLPQLVTDELKAAMHQQLAIEIQKRLDNVTKNVKETLDMIDQRSKDIQGYLVRQTSTSTAQQSPEVTLQPKTE